MFVDSDPSWLLPAIVPFFADLVAIARSPYPIPSRTRPSKSSAPMVLSLKAWKSRSLPGLPRTECFNPHHDIQIKSPAVFPRSFFVSGARARANRPRLRPGALATRCVADVRAFLSQPRLRGARVRRTRAPSRPQDGLRENGKAARLTRGV